MDLSDSSDSELAALLLPVSGPPNIDWFDDSKHYATQFKEMYTALTQLGDYTTHHIAQCFQDETAHEIACTIQEEYFATLSCHVRGSVAENMQALYTAWLRDGLVKLIEPLSEIRSDQVTEDRKVKSVLGANVCWELCRLNWLLNRTDRLRQEDEIEAGEAPDLEWAILKLRSLSNASHPMWLELVNSYDYQPSDKDELPDEEIVAKTHQLKVMWSKPILSYTQQDVILLVMLLTQQLNDVPVTAIEEFIDVFQTLWLRCGDLAVCYWEGTDELDVPSMRKQEGNNNTFQPNRDFYAFIFFYLGDILRRIFWYERTKPKRRPLPANLNVERTKTWIESMLQSIGDDVLIDMYLKHVDHGYKFPGDDAWFKYMWPNRSLTRGVVLGALRPHLHKRYFTEERCTLVSILANPRRFLTRYFILNMVSDEIKIKTGHPEDAFNWFDAVVVAANDLEAYSDMIIEEACPLIIQVFSAYWVHCKRTFYVCDDIYAAISMWFKLLRQEYGGILLGRDLNAKFVRRYEPEEEAGREEAEGENIDWSGGI